MQEYLKERLWVHLRRAAMAVLASAAAAATTVHADRSSSLAPVAPADLAAAAQKTSVAMFLYDRFDGKTLRYALQNQDAGLVTFDVTEPAHTTGRGSVQRSAACQGDALPARGYPAIDTLTAYELSRIFDVKQVRAKMTNGDTGTTFMLTDSGPYMLRRPGEEFIQQMMLIPPNWYAAPERLGTTME